MISGLIFDCDGVLVDSEPLAAEELKIMLEELGVAVDTAEIYDRFLGRSLSSIVKAAFSKHGVDLGPALPRFTKRLARRFRQDLQPVPDIAATLAKLQVPRAVASSSAPERLALSLELTGLAPLFGPHVYSAAQVENGKPAPDLFLLAAARLGVRAGDCVVIEDSPAGISAARAAGMRVIGFLGGGHAEPAGLARKLSALRPDALIEHAADLPKTLEGMG